MYIYKLRARGRCYYFRNIFSKKFCEVCNWRFLLKQLHFFQKFNRDIGFWEKRQFFRQVRPRRTASSMTHTLVHMHIHVCMNCFWMPSNATLTAYYIKNVHQYIHIMYILCTKRLLLMIEWFLPNATAKDKVLTLNRYLTVTGTKG
jgi:hypothetical protein